MLGAFTLASWGPWDGPGTILGRSWDDPGTLKGTRKDTVSSRLGFYRFFIDLGDPFWKLFGYFRTKQKSYLFQVAFSDCFWVWIRASGIGKTSIWHGRYCKNQLSQKLDFLWFQGRFFMILGSLGTTFHGFRCLGDCLENWWIFMVILGSSQILSREWVGGDWPFFWGQ